MVYIYTCNCLLEHILMTPYVEIERSVSNFDIFSINKKIMLLYNGESLHFFCMDAVCFAKRFTKNDIYCLKRSGIWDDTCLDCLVFTGVNNCCINCNILFSRVLEIFLLKIEK